MTPDGGTPPRTGADPRKRWGKPAAGPETAAATPGLAARVAAAAILADVVGAGRTLDEAFGSERPHQKLAGLDARDRALARSICTAGLRRLGTIRKRIAARLDQGMPRKSGPLEWILVAGATQILYLDAPDHAAVDLAVRAARLDRASAPYAALVNAVLRGLAREREAGLAEEDPLEVDTPPWLAQRWRKAYGEELARAIAAAHRDEPPLDLTVKSDPAGWAARLGGVELPTGSVRLETHAPVTELPGYADGEWWVQDAAAALPARILAVRSGERVADLCAAPGGKTATLALAGAEVTAVDRSAERLKRLAANLDRLRLRADVKVADASAFVAPPFDAILIDAPCTATGTIRRHPDVAWAKKASDVAALAALQARLLDQAARLLKPGGRLVYCVCSLEPEEGEGQIEGLLRRNPDLSRAPIGPDEVAGLPVLTPAGDLRTLPVHLPGPTPRLSGLDGFYAARIVRRGTA